MGEMADMALDDTAVFESLVDDYVSGDMSMHEAFEHGILNVDGTELPHVQAAYDRAPISLEYVQKNLVLVERGFTVGELRSIISSQARSLAATVKLHPTCNYCGGEMSPRMGKFGKFYYCSNRCPGQKAVSDAYWQSVRR